MWCKIHCFNKHCIPGIVRDQILFQIWIQHLENRPVKLGHLVTFDSMLRFSLAGAGLWFCEAAPTGIILGSNFWYTNREIRMSINYVRDYIARNAFQNYVIMKENKIQFLIPSLTALE